MCLEMGLGVFQYPTLSLSHINTQDTAATNRLSEEVEQDTPRPCSPLWPWPVQVPGAIPPSSSHGLIESTCFDPDYLHKEDLEISQDARP